MQLLPGTRLGPHEIVGPLGAGGMGEVYLARDTRLDREVALKLLPHRLARDPDALARFRREAFTLASLNHPNIATVYGFEEDSGGHLALVLEHVEGETLSERLRRAPLLAEECLQVCAQIALALETAHDRGIIHRDVKPGNIMMGPRGLVKVLDFGLARRVAGLSADAPPARSASSLTAHEAPSDSLAKLPDEDSLTIALPSGLSHEEFSARSSSGSPSIAGAVVGTPGYMSPEQVRGEPVDERTDVFAFGCVLYECLTGTPAFPGASATEAMLATLNRPADLSALPAGTHPRARELVSRCLEKIPAARLTGMRTARLELEEALGTRRASALREGEAYKTPNNLPSRLTSFVGRAAELVQGRDLLGRSRLLALVGLGGSGKTRLALRLAEDCLEDFPDGVWFVDVAPLVEPERVLEVLAAALGVREEPGQTLQMGVEDSLSGRRALLVLDNCETHRGVCGELALRVLRACPGVKLLITSREPLGVEGETVHPVSPLAFRTPGGPAGAPNEAMELFLERARSASPAFALTPSNESAVSEICARLDGLPLALELAAVRVRTLSVEQIRDRLGDRFRLLTAGTSGGGRQQTIREMIRWSYDQLLAPERELMRRLAVFTGGWTLERAALICSDSNDEFEMLDLLSRLAERSLLLVVWNQENAVRYRFLESVWRFAVEELEASSEKESIRNRHLQVYEGYAEASSLALAGPKQEAQLREMASEEENILAALAWAPRAPDGVLIGLRVASATSRYWTMRGLYGIGRRLTSDALARDTSGARSPERSRALISLAAHEVVRGEHTTATALLEDALLIARENGDRRAIARALAGIGVTSIWTEQFERAAEATSECMAIYQELDSPRGVALALHNLGTIEDCQNRLQQARTILETAVSMVRELEDLSLQLLTSAGLASVLVRLGELPAALGLLREIMALVTRIDVSREAIYGVEAIAEWLEATGNCVAATRLVSWTMGFRKERDLPYMPFELRSVEKRLERLSARAGERAFRAALEAGGKLSLPEAIAEAGASLRETGNSAD